MWMPAWIVEELLKREKREQEVLSEIRIEIDGLPGDEPLPQTPVKTNDVDFYL